MSRHVTQQDIAQALDAMGLSAGDRVLVHSSLSSIGYVEGGADAVLDAFLQVLGPEGTLMVPTFTYAMTTDFDVENTPSKTGRITETLRARPEAVRSFHPSHSLCAVGPNVQDLLAGHEHTDPAGTGSPLDRFVSQGGLVFLLGVGHRANTTVHLGEYHARVPYLYASRNLGTPKQAQVRTPDGRTVPVAYNQAPGCSRNFGAVEEPLRAKGAIRDGRVGEAPCQVMPGLAIVDAVAELVARQPDALLCDHERCRYCAEARRMVREAQDGDA